MQPYQHCQEWHQSPKVETVSLPSWRYISAFRTQGQRRKKATTNHPKSLSRTHEPTWLTRVLESITQSIQFDHKILPFNPATYRWFFWCLQVEVMGSSCHEYTQTLVVGQTWISPYNRCMTYHQEIVCPNCGHNDIRKAGFSALGVQPYHCHHAECATMLTYRCKAPRIKDPIVEMTINSSAIQYASLASARAQWLVR